MILSQSSSIKHQSYLEPPPQTLASFFSNDPFASVDKYLIPKHSRRWEVKDPSRLDRNQKSWKSSLHPTQKLQIQKKIPSLNQPRYTLKPITESTSDDRRFACHRSEETQIPPKPSKNLQNLQQHTHSRAETSPIEQHPVRDSRLAQNPEPTEKGNPHFTTPKTPRHPRNSKTTQPHTPVVPEILGNRNSSATRFETQMLKQRTQIHIRTCNSPTFSSCGSMSAIDLPIDGLHQNDY